MKINYSQVESAIRKAITDTIGPDTDRAWGDYKFYTQEMWQTRGERWGNDSILSMTFEGRINHKLNSSANLYEAIQNALKPLGLYFEMGFAWSLHTYPL